MSTGNARYVRLESHTPNVMYGRLSFLAIVFSQQVSTASGVCFDVLQSVFTQAVGSYSTARSIWSLME
jgi:hypothetical protein